jgi:hypothetical protein
MITPTHLVEKVASVDFHIPASLVLFKGHRRQRSTKSRAACWRHYLKKNVHCTEATFPDSMLIHHPRCHRLLQDQPIKEALGFRDK